jgi:hypothetical protein
MVVWRQNQQLCLHHADARKSPDPGVPPPVVGHFEMGKGRWYLVNDALDDACVLEATGASLFKRGDRVDLAPGMKIVLGREEGFRVGYVQMIHTT